MVSIAEAIAHFREVAVRGGDVWDDGLRHLAGRGYTVVEPLLALLSDEIADVRSGAASVLSGWQDDDRIVTPLVAALSDDSPDVRRASAATLGGTGHVKAVRPLARMLADESVDVRLAAVSGLVRLRHPEGLAAVAQAMWDDAAIVWSATRALSASEEFGLLRAAIKDGVSIDPSMAARAMVGEWGAQAVDRLIEMLDSADWRLRSTAASLLGELRDSRAVARLRRAAQDGEWRARIAAGKSLALLGDGAGLELLASMLEDDRAGTHAAVALGGVDASTVIETPLCLLHGSDSQLRLIGAQALRSTPDSRAVLPLVAALRDGIASAAGALAIHDDPTAIDALTEALRSGDVAVRLQAVRALANHGGSAAVGPVSLLLNDSLVCVEAVRALYRIGDPSSTGALVDALASPNAQCRRMVAWGLSEVRTPLAEEALLNLVVSDDIDAVSGAYSFYIGSGRRDFEPALLRSLTYHGHRAAAEDYAGCANTALADAGQRWLEDHPNARYTFEP